MSLDILECHNALSDSQHQLQKDGMPSDPANAADAASQPRASCMLGAPSAKHDLAHPKRPCYSTVRGRSALRVPHVLDRVDVRSAALALRAQGPQPRAIPFERSTTPKVPVPGKERQLRQPVLRKRRRQATQRAGSGNASSGA